MDNVLWTPQPRQAEFMARPEFEALYGGAAGGGKTDTLLMEGLRQVDEPAYKGIIFRKTFPQLKEVIDRSQLLYKGAYPKAKYNGSNHCWTFPSGAKIYLSGLQHSEDRLKHQGISYCYVAFDELTHFDEIEYKYLFSRCRPSGTKRDGTPLRCYIRATTNPSGRGMGWVMNRFRPETPMQTMWERHRIPDGKGGTITVGRDRIFVPATIYDNQALLNNQPEYLASLAMLPEAEREALLLGSWQSFSGQVFRSWRNVKSHYLDREWTHVIEPFPIPKDWRVIKCFDFGYTRPSAIYWIAMPPRSKQKFIIREFYTCTGEANVGTQMHHIEIAEKIREIEDQDPNLQGRKIQGVADPAIFDKSRGASIAEDMAKAPNYVIWHAGNHNRIQGKMQFHYHLAFDKTGTPMLQVFNTCKHFIRTIPVLCYDESNPEDIDSDQEDHAYDAVRYALMDNPIGARKNETNEKEEGSWGDPLNQRTGKSTDAIVFDHF